MNKNISSSGESCSSTNCPFCNAARPLCLASSTGITPDPRRKLKYCLSEDFDSCPFFLFRCLRASPAKNYNRHIRTASEH